MVPHLATLAIKTVLLSMGPAIPMAATLGYSVAPSKNAWMARWNLS